jgi:hypothetical protein
MEIIVTAFATIVAAGCFIAILSNDLKEVRADGDASDEADDSSQGK